jgi:hypothetical protein
VFFTQKTPKKPIRGPWITENAYSILADDKIGGQANRKQKGEQLAREYISGTSSKPLDLFQKVTRVITRHLMWTTVKKDECRQPSLASTENALTAWA